MNAKPGTTKTAASYSPQARPLRCGFPIKARRGANKEIGWEDIAEMTSGTVERKIIDDTLPVAPLSALSPTKHPLIAVIALRITRSPGSFLSGRASITMLPSVVASELEQVAQDAIRTAFHPTTPGFNGLIDRFTDREQLLKGPYVSVSLPFHQGSGRDWFPEIPLPFPPYRHQESLPAPAPWQPPKHPGCHGTGSGKTECFLLPIAGALPAATRPSPARH